MSDKTKTDPNPTPFTELVGERSGPSDLELDRLHHGELDDDAAAALRARVAEDPDAQRRLEARELGFSAFSGLDPDALLGRIHQQVVAEEAADAREEAVEPPGLLARFVRWLTSPAGMGVMAVAAACVVAIVVSTRPSPSPGPGDPDPIDRPKGVNLSVFVLRADRVTQALPGDPFFAGDQLRFQVTTSRPGHAMVVYRDAAGALAAAWPFGAAVSEPLSAGTAQELEGFIRLDSSVGTETLALIVCPLPFGFGQLGWTDGLTPPHADCAVSSFALDKRAGP